VAHDGDDGTFKANVYDYDLAVLDVEVVVGAAEGASLADGSPAKAVCRHAVCRRDPRA
jgi:hypothetical protein